MKRAGPAYLVPVSESEKEKGKEIRAAFENVLSKQDSFLDYLGVFFEQLDELSSDPGLVKISPLLKRYEHKLKKIFNLYIKSLSKALITYEKSFSITELDEIRDLIIENIRNVRQETIELLRLFQDVSSTEFINNSKAVYSNIVKILEQVESTIREEWFGYIDYNILGTIKLGTQIPLTLR